MNAQLNFAVQSINSEAICMRFAFGRFRSRIFMEAIANPLPGSTHSRNICASGDLGLNPVCRRDIPDDPVREVFDGVG